MLAWMLYSTVLAALFGLAASAVERALRVYGRPTRWVWTAALGASLGVPVAVAGWVRWEPVRMAVSGGGGESGMVVVPLEPVAAVLEGAAGLPPLDGPLAAVWVVASAALAGYVGLSLRTLRRRRRAWRRAEIDGSPVLVSRSTGPAVVGALRGEVVLPEWVLRLERSARALLIAHEREHARSRDLALLTLGLCAVVAMPWNPVLWWQLRRLRLAVEVDCDARVLGRGIDRSRYGEVLLEAGRRSHEPVAPLAIGFSVRRSQLERRIRYLTAAAPRHRLGRAASAVALAAAVLAVACEVPAPAAEGGASGGEDASAVGTGPTGDVTDRSGGAGELDRFSEFTPEMVRPELENRGEVMEALGRHYPTELLDAGIGARVYVWLWIDEEGSVVHTEVQRSSGHEALDRAALEVAGIMDFAPAMDAERPVPVVVAFPITFQVN